MSVFDKAMTVLMLVFFGYATVMQYNDPDPLLWMTIYSVAAILCAMHLMGRLPVRAGLVFIGLIIIHGLYLAYRIIGPRFFDEREMIGVAEEGREMIGVIIVAAWTGFMVWRTRGRRRQR